jgi:hypothetical protein
MPGPDPLKSANTSEGFMFLHRFATRPLIFLAASYELAVSSARLWSLAHAIAAVEMKDFALRRLSIDETKGMLLKFPVQRI